MYGQARNSEQVPAKIKNTAKRDLSVPARRSHHGYNLSYFNLWWSRMGVEARRDAKVQKLKEEESLRIRRKRKMMNIMNLPVDGIDDCILVDSSQKKTCLSVNVSGVGQSTLQGVTLEEEGEGVMVTTTGII